jgi:hypothetical protein
MSIVQVSGLPRAIAKEKNGIVLYWVEELGVAGLHINGLASLLQCNPKTAKSAIEAVTQITLFDAEMVTEQGLRTVTLLSETDLATVLRYISRSKCKSETRDRADDVRDKLVAAGFKLMVMMELAPAELAARAVSHLDKEIELEQIRNKGRELDVRKSELENDTLRFRQSVYDLQRVEVADRIFGVTTIETTKVRDRIVDDSGYILNAANTVSKTELAHRYGFVTKTGNADTKTVTKLINEAIASGAISNPWHDIRVVASSGFDAELVPILDKFFDSNPQQRQQWIGEN